MYIVEGTFPIINGGCIDLASDLSLMVKYEVYDFDTGSQMQITRDELDNSLNYCMNCYRYNERQSIILFCHHTTCELHNFIEYIGVVEYPFNGTIQLDTALIFTDYSSEDKLIYYQYGKGHHKNMMDEKQLIHIAMKHNMSAKNSVFFMEDDYLYVRIIEENSYYENYKVIKFKVPYEFFVLKSKYSLGLL